MMINIKELAGNISQRELNRYKKGEWHLETPYEVVAVCLGGDTVYVNRAVLSRIAKVVSVVDARIGVAHAAKGGATVPAGRWVPGDSFTTYSWDIAYTVEHKALILTSGTTIWTLYHQETK